ncbi:MAG TPA: hypothetical protein VF505_14220 [Thermoanaerobaculia bacterium]
MNRKSLVLWISLTLLAVAAGAQTVPVDLEVGYRWLSLSGSSDMYRTQINERDGFLIRALTISGNDTPFTDHFRLDATDLGAGPAGALRLDFGKTSLYRFNLAYRQTNAFSALPGFANPFLGQGVVPGQHTYDRDRRMVDADLEILKWSAITPFIGFSSNRYSGPGTSTYHVGEDEFALLSSLTNRDQEIRGGAGFAYSRFTGQITQGWRTFRDHESLTLAPGANAGNNLDPVLGSPVNATTITRNDTADGHTPFTNAYVTGQFTNRVRVIGNYVRFAANANSNEDEAATGSFASFALSRFFGGLTDTVSGRAKNTTWRGGARAEIALTDKVDFLAGYQREHRELEGTALINDLFLQTVNFGGVDPKDVQTIINAKNSFNRDEDVLNAAFSARALGPFSVRAGFSESKQDVNVAPDLEEIVVPGPSQSGKFSRRVNSSDLSGSYSKKGFLLGAAWRHDSANDPIIRTDFLSRDRFRVRAGWTMPSNFFRAGVVAEESTPKNDRSDFQFDSKIRQYTADAEIAPTAIIRVRASASRYRADSSILYRHPENFTTATSVHAENGKSYEGGVILTFAPASVDAAYSRFDNSGTTPFTIDRYRARVTFKLFGKTGAAAEWDRDRYNEPAPSFGNFDANRYGIYLRWNQ